MRPERRKNRRRGFAGPSGSTAAAAGPGPSEQRGVAQGKPDLERQLDYVLKAASFSPPYASSHKAVSSSVRARAPFPFSSPRPSGRLDVDPFHLPASADAVLRSERTQATGGGAPGKRPRDASGARRLDVPGSRGYALLKLGRLEEARKTLARGESQFLETPRTFLNLLWGQIRFQIAAAERDAATIEKLERLILPPLLDRRADALTLMNGTQFVCPALALLGRTDESIRILLRSVDAGIPPPYDFLLASPVFGRCGATPALQKCLLLHGTGPRRSCGFSARPAPAASCRNISRRRWTTFSGY